jgi:hypothetical protein
MTEGREDSPPWGELRIRGLAAAAWGFYRGSVRRLAGPSLAVAVPLFVLPVVAFVAWDGGNGSEALWVSIFFARESLFQFGGSLIVALAAVVVSEDLRGGRTTVPEAVTRLRPHRSALVISALYSVILGLTSRLVPVFALVLPVLFLGPPILVQVIALENRSAGEAGARAKALLKGHTLRVLGSLFPVILVLRFLELLTLFAVFGTLDALGANVAAEALTVVQGAITGLFFGLLILPFTAALSLACYLDLRARSERLDLASLGQGRPSPAATPP